jgi:hypothetical protein
VSPSVRARQDLRDHLRSVAPHELYGLGVRFGVEGDREHAPVSDRQDGED